MSKKNLFDRVKEDSEQRSVAEQQDSDRRENRPARGLFKRVQEAEKEASGGMLYRRDTLNLRPSDVDRGVTTFGRASRRRDDD